MFVVYFLCVGFISFLLNPVFVYALNLSIQKANVNDVWVHFFFFWFLREKPLQLLY